MDYKKEYERIGENSEFLSLPEGESTLLGLGEFGEPKEHEFKGEKSMRRELLVEFRGQKKIWTLKLGGKRSVYGQVMEIGAKYGTLKDVYIRVGRRGLGKDDTRYMIFDGGRKEEKLATGQLSPSEQHAEDVKACVRGEVF